MLGPRNKINIKINKIFLIKIKDFGIIAQQGTSLPYMKKSRFDSWHHIGLQKWLGVVLDHRARSKSGPVRCGPQTTI